MKKLNEKKSIFKDEDLKRLSIYAKFHFKCLGFNFQENETGKIYTKGEFWDTFRDAAIAVLNRKGADPIPPSGFTLVEIDHSNDLNDIIEYIKNRK